MALNEILRIKFLDFFNNYLTPAKFAERNEISESEAKIIIKIGGDLHEQHCERLKLNKN